MPGDFIIADRPVNSFIQPAGLPITTPHLEVLRRPLDFALVAAMAFLGGREMFGVRELLPDRIHADVGKLLDAIFGWTLVLLNDLLRLTPVERLAGVALTAADEEPASTGPFEEWSRESVRWQLGLELPSASAVSSPGNPVP